MAAPKSWSLTTYTNNTYTDLVAEESVLTTILISNTTAGAITVAARISLNNAVILPPTSLAANDSKVLDVRSLSLASGQSLQVQASAAGVNFIASGADWS